LRKINRRTAQQRLSRSVSSVDAQTVELDRRVNSDRRQKNVSDFVGLFNGIPPHIVEELLENSCIEEFGCGEQILMREQQNDSIRILLSGNLKVEIGSESSNRFISIQPGECIGELSIIDNRPVSANVFAETLCRLFVIHKNQLLASIGRIPALARNLLTVLVERIRNTDATLEKGLLRELQQQHREQTLKAEALLERHHALAQMVAGVAHEINTPLGIASTAHSVIESRLSLPKIKAIFDENDETRNILADILESSLLIKRNILRAHKLVETFKKISVSQITETKEKVNLSELVAESVDLFRINARQANLTIDIDASGITGDPEWLGYPGYLTQVVMNILQNIERYAYPAGQGGKVEIIATDKGGNRDAEFSIVVRDYGAGISPENLPKIFDPFFTTGRGRGGAGLGLSIVNNIVKSALKGCISVKSELNHGTVFTIDLPKITPD
jgi:signal transduction histidine kinase